MWCLDAPLSRLRDASLRDLHEREYSEMFDNKRGKLFGLDPSIALLVYIIPDRHLKPCVETEDEM